MSDKKVFFGISESADFENNTWEFEMIFPYSVGAGKYAIMRENDYQSAINQRDELLTALKRAVIMSELDEGWEAIERIISKIEAEL